MDELVRLLTQWQVYAVLGGTCVVWYGLAILISHMVDGSTEDAASASTTGIFAALIVALITSSLGSYFWLGTIIALVTCTVLSLLLILAIVGIGSKLGR